MNTVPTTKVANMIKYGMEAYRDGRMAFAQFVEHGWQLYEDETGNEEIISTPGHYVISYHNGGMPAFNTESFDTIEELAARMRDFQDLRKWRKFYIEE